MRGAMLQRNKFMLILSLVFIFLIALFVFIFISSAAYFETKSGKIEGIWYHPKINCLEGAYTIYIFENGKAYQYSSVHKAYSSLGVYKNLEDGKYELTDSYILKEGTDAHGMFKKIYLERASEFVNVKLLPNGNFLSTSKRVLVPKEKYMVYDVDGEGEVKLRRMTGVGRFEKLYRDFVSLKSNQERDVISNCKH